MFRTRCQSNRVVVLPCALLATAACLLASGCRKDEQPASRSSASADRLNVLLIVVDTLRADRLGCYGGKLGLTPNVDALAGAGVRFDGARAHAPWTLPSVASLLTSKHPAVHGAGGRMKQFTPLSGRAPTIAEVFRSEGYRTGAIINVLWLTGKFGMVRGFDHVDYFTGTSNVHQRAAAETTDAVLKWFAADDDKPFFALVHYFDPHLVYDPPDEFRRRFADPADKESGQLVFGTTEDMISLRRERRQLEPDLVHRLEKLYNAEVAYTDQQIGRLLEQMASAGFRDNTIIALTADHGEEFHDHGGFEHGHSLYAELLCVPLILAGPEIPAGVNIVELVGLIDVAPTLCQLAGIRIPAAFSGQTLVPTLDGAPLTPRAVLSEGNMWGPMLYSLQHDRYKLIRHPKRMLLFDTATDPTEQTNVFRSRPAEAGRLADDLTVLLRTLESERVGADAPADLTAEDLERLCALGYVDCPE